MLLPLLTTVVCCFAFIAYAKEGQISPQTQIVLKAPDLSEEHFLGAKVGIRPYRKSGIRLEKEYHGDKCIFHNYGYGGSGLTLCWGGAQIIQDLILQEIKKNPFLANLNQVAVLGAGVIGLSTAYELLKLGYEVKIYADQFSPHLTSDIAAGIWSPPSTQNIESKEKKHILQKMLELSKARYLQSALSKQPEFLGVQLIDDYNFKNQNSKKGLKNFGSDFEEEIQEVCVRFENGLQKKGTLKRILSINGKVFLRDLFQQVQSMNGSIMQCHFENLQEALDLDEKLIVNCLSFGSEKVFHDQDFFPVRGHLLVFNNVNHVNYMAYENVNQETSCWVTIYPRDDELIVGGTFEEGVEDTSVDLDIVQKMLENTKNCFCPKAEHKKEETSLERGEKE